MPNVIQEKCFFCSYSVCEPGHEWFQELNEVLAKSDEELRKFRELKHELKKVGHFEAETPFNRANSPHLYTWFQTNEAIIMLLSNKTFQVGFFWFIAHLM